MLCDLCGKLKTTEITEHTEKISISLKEFHFLSFSVISVVEIVRLEEFLSESELRNNNAYSVRISDTSIGYQ